MLSRTEQSSFTVIQRNDRDTLRVYRLYDFIKAQLVQPHVAYCEAGQVYGSDGMTS